MKETFLGYLDAIYKIHLEENRMVRIGEIAEWMDISDASASEMARRLAASRLIIIQPYKGVYLTRKGLEIAISILKSFYLIELFFSSVLKLKNPELAADHIAYSFPKDAITALEKFLRKNGFSKRIDAYFINHSGVIAIAGRAKEGTSGLSLFYFGEQRFSKRLEKLSLEPHNRITILKKEDSETLILLNNKKIRVLNEILGKLYMLIQ